VDYVIRSTGEGFEMLAGPFEQPEAMYPGPEWDAYERQTADALAQYPGAELVSAENVGSMVGLVDKRTAMRVVAKIIPCPECAIREYDEDDEPLPPKKGPGCFYCKGKGEVEGDRKLPTAWPPPTVQDMLDYRRSSLQTVAHDSGDGKTIYHCPFCGAGQVVAGSDGTTECQFCKTFFTVQVQPEFASFPQTINGQPVQVPGMPGDPTQPSPPPDGAAPTTDDPDAAFQPPDQEPAFQPPAEKDTPPDKPNPFQGARTALYVVPEGVAIPEDSFMRRLALEHAPDREAMLADLRASR
jgi:ribosomal protein L37AE/L43A